MKWPSWPMRQARYSGMLIPLEPFPFRLNRSGRSSFAYVAKGGVDVSSFCVAIWLVGLRRSLASLSSYAKRANRCPQPLCAAAIVYFCKDCEASELFASVDYAERQRDRCGRKAEPVVVLQGGP